VAGAEGTNQGVGDATDSSAHTQGEEEMHRNGVPLADKPARVATEEKQGFYVPLDTV